MKGIKDDFSNRHVALLKDVFAVVAVLELKVPNDNRWRNGENRYTSKTSGKKRRR